MTFIDENGNDFHNEIQKKDSDINRISDILISFG